MMPNSPKMLFVTVVCFVFGAMEFVEWIPNFVVRNAPVVKGNVEARKPIMQWGVPRVDFTIKLADQDATVHAFTQRYLIHKVPNQVRFHYSGDASREVFLMEHEENPLWIALTCWAASLFLGFILYGRWRGK